MTFHTADAARQPFRDFCVVIACHFIAGNLLQLRLLAERCEPLLADRDVAGLQHAEPFRH